MGLDTHSESKDLKDLNLLKSLVALFKDQCTKVEFLEMAERDLIILRNLLDIWIGNKYQTIGDWESYGIPILTKLLELYQGFGDSRLIDESVFLLEELLDRYSSHIRQRRDRLFPGMDERLEKFSDSQPNILEKLGKERNENLHSDFLAALLDHDNCGEIAVAFLGNILCAAHADLPDLGVTIIDRILQASKQNLIRVRREFPIDNGMRIDILLIGPEFYLIIENKVDSREHDDQTIFYYNWCEAHQKGNGKSIIGIFLSPGRMSASCPHFLPLDYEDVTLSLAKALFQKGIKRDDDKYLFALSYLQCLRKMFFGKGMKGAKHGQ